MNLVEKKRFFDIFQLARGKTTRQTIRSSPRNPVWYLRTSNAVHSKLFLRYFECIKCYYSLIDVFFYYYLFIYIKYVFIAQWARKFKSPGKKKNQTNPNVFFREIAFLAIINFFPIQKLIFGHF